MKKTNVVLFIAVVASMVGLLWVRYSQRDHNEAAHSLPPTVDQPRVLSSSASNEPIVPVALPNRDEVAEEQKRRLAELGIVSGMTKEEIEAKLAEWTNSQRAKSTDVWRSPIEFYGKVVDENTNPVAQASVTFIWNDLSAAGTSKTNTVSDPQGTFGLTGVTGRGLSVYVEKPGYYVSKKLNRNDFDFSQGYRGDRNNPEIFFLRRKGDGVSLITSDHGILKTLNFSAPLDGTPIHVDFRSRKTGASGQMSVSQIKPAYEVSKDATEWSYRLTIPDGGFVEHDDEFPFLAPEHGYVPVIEFIFRKGEASWATRVNKSYYIAFGSPRQYGRIRFQTSINSGTVLEYAINPDGTRNLEPK